MPDHADSALLDAGLRRIGLISHADTKAGLTASGATAANTDALRATFAATTGPHRATQALLVLTAVTLSGAGLTADAVLARVAAAKLAAARRTLASAGLAVVGSAAWTAWAVTR